MSLVPDHWAEPGSIGGLLYELLWVLLVLITLGVFLVFQPLFVELNVTLLRLSVSMLLGTVGGILLPIVSVRERGSRWWNNFRNRFITMFIITMLFQVSLLVIPTWLILTGITLFTVSVPVRIAIYLRARS